MTVRENIAFGLQIRKVAPDEINRLVDEAAGILGLKPLLDRKPKALSGGQRQRVALGRAIVRKPSVFLFDEPLSNLDAKLRVQMRAEIKRIQQRLGTTSIYVTHDQVEAMTMGHRIAILNAGKLQQVGTPLEVYERPANLFVAAFIGMPPMNFVRAKLADGGARLDAGAFSFPVPAAVRARTGGAAPRPMVAGIRPENVLPAGREARGEAAPVAAVVEIVETLGDEVVVHARAGDHLLVYKDDPHRAPQFGERVTVSLDLASLHLFDAETEQRVT
jgi:multiple sugar transport system ATP-binding protein